MIRRFEKIAFYVLAFHGFMQLVRCQDWPPIIFNATNTTTFQNRVLLKLRPHSLISTRKSIGNSRKNRTAGLWSVDACLVEGKATSVPSALLLMPVTLPYMDNTLAEDVVGRQVSNDPQSVIGANGNAALTIGESIVAGIGAAKNNHTMLYVAAGASVVQLLINGVMKKAPNAQVYFSRLLPEVVPLSAGSCGQWYLFSGLVKEPRVQVFEVRF